MTFLLTLFSILAVIVIVIFISNIRFNQNTKKEVDEMFNSCNEKSDQVIREEDLEGLPTCVKGWLKNSRIIGKRRITTVRLRQKATMRLKKDQAWMPVEAEQYFTTEKPGFIWKAKIKAAPFFHIAGRDKYFNGKGRMLIKLLSIITVADAQGKEVDQGSLLRYLGETCWFPTVALSEYITWEEIDSNSARAIMSYGGITDSGVFTFNEKGEVINFVAERYMEKEGRYSLETWSARMKEHMEFNGISIPSRGEITWQLDGGDFTWFKFEITEIEYNKPVVYH